jgi:hypothetical protein
VEIRRPFVVVIEPVINVVSILDYDNDNDNDRRRSRNICTVALVSIQTNSTFASAGSAPTLALSAEPGSAEMRLLSP